MIKRFIKDNSSVILSVGACVGVISTAYLAGQAGYRTAHKLENEDPTMELKEKARIVWRLYIPTGATAAATIIFVAGIKHVDGRKTLAAQTALAVSQRAYESYRAEVIDELGERKDQTLLARVAEKKVKDNPPSTIVAVSGSGRVLCCELFTSRYFLSDMDALNKAVNEINAKMLRHDYATLDDFYYEINLENTMVSGQSGWSSDKLMALEFSTVLRDGVPCLAFSYNYIKSF
jgi:hypothetical protein